MEYTEVGGAAVVSKASPAQTSFSLRKMVAITIVACFACAAVGVVIGVTWEQHNNNSASSSSPEAEGTSETQTALTVTVPRSRSAALPEPDLKNLVEIAVGYLTQPIPIVGKVINLLIDTFWPHNQPVSVWDQIKDQVTALVHQEVLNAELNERNRDLLGLKETMSYYSNAQNDERKSLLSAMVSRCNDITAQLHNSPNRKHMISLTGTFYLMHMTILAERYQNGHVLYSGDRSAEAQWAKDLSNTFETYVAVSGPARDEFRAWRLSLFRIETSQQNFCALFASSFTILYRADLYDDLTNRHEEFYISHSCAEEGSQDEVRKLAETKRDEWLNVDVLEANLYVFKTALTGARMLPQSLRPA